MTRLRGKAGRGPTLENLPERERFESWWIDFCWSDGGNMLDQFDLDQQALIAGFAKRVWRAALAAPRRADKAGKG